MASDVMNYPEISFIGGCSLADWLEQGKEWYVERFLELTGESLTLHDTDEEKILLDAIGYMFYQVMQYVDYTGKQNLLKYSVGDFLDNVGARCGVKRGAASRASVTVRFTLTAEQDVDYMIPAGTQTAPSSSDNIFFAVESDTKIPTGELYADAVCLCTLAGEDGNGFLPGEVDELVDALPYIDSVLNITTSDGGADAESDDDFADRIYYAPSLYSTAGSEDSYIYHVKSASVLVGDVIVYSPEPCRVDIIITSKNGGVPSEELLRTVTDYLMEKQRKVLSDLVTVRGPDTKTFDVSLTYYISTENQKYAGAIKEKIEDAVSDYIVWQTEKIGRNVTPSKLIQMVMEAGAKRVEIDAPADIVLENDEIAVLGEKLVTYGGLEDE